MNLKIVNRVCPNCKNPNYIAVLGDFSKVYKYKCMNCNKYFIDFEEEPLQPVWKTECMNKKHVLFTARQHVEECLNKARVRYGGETAEFLMFAKGIRDACWAIDELISTHNEGTEQNDE